MSQATHKIVLSEDRVGRLRLNSLARTTKNPASRAFLSGKSFSIYNVVCDVSGILRCWLVGRDANDILQPKEIAMQKETLC